MKNTSHVQFNRATLGVFLKKVPFSLIILSIPSWSYAGTATAVAVEADGDYCIVEGDVAMAPAMAAQYPLIENDDIQVCSLDNQATEANALLAQKAGQGKKCKWGYGYGNIDPCDTPKSVTDAMNDLKLPEGSGARQLLECIQRRESACHSGCRTGSQKGLFQMKDQPDYQECRDALSGKGGGWDKKGCDDKDPYNGYCATLCAAWHLMYGKGDQWEVGRRCRDEAHCPQPPKGLHLHGKCGFP